MPNTLTWERGEGQEVWVISSWDTLTFSSQRFNAHHATNTARYTITTNSTAYTPWSIASTNEWKPNTVRYPDYNPVSYVLPMKTNVHKIRPYNSLDPVKLLHCYGQYNTWKMYATAATYSCEYNARLAVVGQYGSSGIQGLKELAHKKIGAFALFLAHADDEKRRRSTAWLTGAMTSVAEAYLTLIQIQHFMVSLGHQNFTLPRSLKKEFAEVYTTLRGHLKCLNNQKR